MNRFKTLSHTKWECKYHVVWIPKYRRRSVYGIKKSIIISSIKKWAHIKEVEILEGYAMKDHIHLRIYRQIMLPKQYQKETLQRSS